MHILHSVYIFQCLFVLDHIQRARWDFEPVNAKIRKLIRQTVVRQLSLATRGRNYTIPSPPPEGITSFLKMIASTFPINKFKLQSH